MGDDLLDLPVLARVGLSAAPADAAPEVRARVHWVSACGRRPRRGARADRARACAPRDAGTPSCSNTARACQDVMESSGRCCSARWSRCSPASPSARPGSATSCRTAAGSIGAARASRRTTCSASTSWSPTRSIWRSRSWSKAAHGAGDPLEIHMILGNLYREKGQVGRAIQVHQACCSARISRKLEHANVLLCLGLDYKRGGFVDRALEAFNEVLRLDPEQPVRAARTSRSCTKNSISGPRPTRRGRSSPRRPRPEPPARHHEILAFLENEIGLRGAEADGLRRGGAAVRGGDRARRARTRRRTSISATSGTTKATSAGAIAAWERLIERRPSARIWRSRGSKARIRNSATPARFAELCRRLIAANPQDWRARLALARHLSVARRLRRSARAAVRGARAEPARARASTRRSGRRSRACTCRPRSSIATSS